LLAAAVFDLAADLVVDFLDFALVFGRPDFARASGACFEIDRDLVGGIFNETTTRGRNRRRSLEDSLPNQNTKMKNGSEKFFRTVLEDHVEPNRIKPILGLQI
jgi:hypothetical protein